MVVTLVLVAAVLAPASVVARWAHDEVADTDRYVETVAPLAHDPAVQKAVADRVTAELFARIDVKAVTDEAVAALSAQGLPPRVAVGLNALSAPLASGIQSFVHDQITKLVQSDVFAAAWVQANREAHAQMVAVLSGEGTDTVNVKGDTVSINLAAIIDVVKKRLSDRGFTLAERIPTVNAQFTIFQSADLTKAQTVFRLLNTLARWLPVLALLLLALAVYVARRRRQTLIWSAVAVAASMLVLGAALNIFRPVYLNAIDPRVLPTPAAAAIYDQLVGFIRLNLRAVLVVALAVAAGAWVTGPAGATTRTALSRGVGWLRGGAEHAGLDTGPFGAAVYRWRPALRGVIVGVAVLVYLLQAHPTGGVGPHPARGHRGGAVRGGVPGPPARGGGAVRCAWRAGRPGGRVRVRSSHLQQLGQPVVQRDTRGGGVGQRPEVVAERPQPEAVELVADAPQHQADRPQGHDQHDPDPQRQLAAERPREHPADQHGEHGPDQCRGPHEGPGAHPVPRR
ncbi:hypothetical protein KRR39_02795 [Nocardioides panacis]|uniref:Integral membrane protein n=1 Tax=Nocardioides panacis TaxID=2849501 RepID=A0A975Y0S7_9ACTN|nr:hypothetical protein [Nocardioides panacis]QWZ08798.1 hypothetical protein KRR39_02795 [Nocardioides panacis]